MLNLKGCIEKVSSIAAGHNHLLALTTRAIFTLGVPANKTSWDGRTELGVTSQRTSSPASEAKFKVVAIGTGAMTSFAIDENGTLWGWGLNNLGQTGTGSKQVRAPVPTKVLPPSSPCTAVNTIQYVRM